MSEGSQWTPGKIFLLIVGILAVLGILCCGAGWLIFGEQIKSAVALATDTAAFMERLKAEFGKSARFGVEKNDRQELVLTIGVDGELTPERAETVQDAAWKAFAETYAEHGFLPIKFVAVGKPIGGSDDDAGGVVEWSAHVVPVDELVKRTGAAAPPVSKILPKEFKGRRISVQVSSDDGTEAEKPAEDAPKEKKVDGADGK